MRRSFIYLLSGLMLFGLAGCSSLLDGSNEISVRESLQPGPDAPKVKYAASIRVAGYADERNVGDARKIGIAKVRVVGMRGPNIRLDRDATEVVAASVRKRLDDTGFLMLEAGDPGAMFELSGVVRELSYDAKERDYVSIAVETTLKEIATGKVIWSGAAVQKSERFAGVSGNSKEDIAAYLHHELNIVAGKTAEAISTTLMASRSDLFNLMPGTKAIPGVTVFTTPGTESRAPTTPTAMPPVLTNALLVVRTEPVNAKIYLDGVYYGVSPLQVRVPAGIYTVEARQKGYRAVSEKVAVRLDNTTELEMQLEK